ncbi:MAG: hypothetical protein KatS3mg044_1117 [Rhodothermaceae bacterium]|nr:MAG: hypothetical protein KatS3mg044_1117 [Rhodothermaceae bacterium]
MKLRIQGNSLRLRLAASEVEALRTGGRVEETMRLGPDRLFRYILTTEAEASSFAVRFDGRTLMVILPAAEASGWIETDRVGLEAAIPVGAGEVLRVLVERDLPCRHGRGAGDG